MEAWEHIAPELPPGWSVENSGDMDYQQNWATRAADGTVTERGFCGREYAVEDCWEQFGITRKRYAELIAPGLVREAAEKALGDDLRCVEMSDEVKQGRGSCFIVYAQREDEGWPREHFRGHGPTICDADWACIQALGGGE